MHDSLCEEWWVVFLMSWLVGVVHCVGVSYSSTAEPVTTPDAVMVNSSKTASDAIIILYEYCHLNWHSLLFQIVYLPKETATPPLL